MNDKNHEILEKKLIVLKTQAELMHSEIEEIREFSSKQLSLLEQLAKKFPNIEQFSTSLHDAQAINGVQDNLNKIVDEIKAELFEIEDILEIDKNEKNSKKELENSAKALLHEIEEIEYLDNLSLLKEEIDTLILKFGK